MAPPVVRVPIVFCGAGIVMGRAEEDPISTADIAPTVMEALGRSPRNDIYHESLWNDKPDQSRNLMSEV